MNSGFTPELPEGLYIGLFATPPESLRLLQTVKQLAAVADWTYTHWLTTSFETLQQFATRFAISDSRWSRLRKRCTSA